ARRDRVIVHAAERRRAAPAAVVGWQVLAERCREDRQRVVEVVHADADDLARLVGQRSDVDVLAVAVLADELPGDLRQLVDRLLEPDAKNPTRALESLVVLAQPEQVDLLVGLVPVAPDPLEAAGSVVESVRL